MHDTRTRGSRGSNGAGQEMEALSLLDETSALVKALCLDTGRVVH